MPDPIDAELYSTSLYLNPDKDDLFEKGPWPKPFTFNEEVARVFDNMVSRSVPLYREVIACAVHWAHAYYQPNTQIVDIGCSTGTFLELLGRFLKQPAQLVGIDNSEAMLEKAHEKLKEIQHTHQVKLICANAEDISFDNSSVVVINYTLQFLPVKQRQTLLRSLYEGLVPGGLLFLSEKVKSPHPRLQETVTLHYEAFKTRNGYARTEIERKKEALENVLVPLTEQQQIQMLRDSGFEHIDTLIKLHNFVSLVALK
ncbi:carboxy-S-adenosyl-L-methionine synthase CmoA [Oscillatoria sp. FACHB-1407]|uniref:carboxy-S-adenosyl-L-methionine synthase CmoA n=1 Tax=Oscillatoria sp. FACHB-1407 TaxID=2692847 RepID=UPI001681E1DD|nr:carboxy-S-adenosyl-L-methionine synthase CmoA [Oscillatoria sp. FACHB-1407]MBD2461312.1 carboxy-S-adenosyl-L-methionine synthase CmoA [Oscillatoria sp. FACHB-1407]